LLDREEFANYRAGFIVTEIFGKAVSVLSARFLAAVPKLLKGIL